MLAVPPISMLVGVTVVLVILITPYLRPWLAQRSDIAARRAEVETLQRQVDQLTVERNRWNDPTFVRAQARQKLNFVMPGELGYVVLDEGRERKPADLDGQAVLGAGKTAGHPWYDMLWQSVQLAGQSTAPADTPSGTVPGSLLGGGAGTAGTSTPEPS